MRKLLHFLLPALLACVVLVPGSYAADDQAKVAGKAATDPAHDAAMTEMMAAAQPGPMHQALTSMAGTWKATVKMWR